MSDFVGSRYNKQEDFQVLLSKKGPGEPPQHKHYLWMAHWTKASGSAEPRNNHGSSNPLEDTNKGTTKKDSETLPYEFTESTVAKRLMVGVSHGSASMQHARQFDSSVWGIPRHVSNELGPKNSEHVDESFEKSMKKDAVNLRARAVVSETYSIHKLSELPLDFQNFGSSDDPSPDWSHFPMFEINRKIDSILNRKRRSALGPAPLNLNVSASHVMALSSQEYMMHSHQIADENMDMCNPAEGFASHIEDPAGLNSDPSGPKLKGQLLDTMSCSCSKEDNNSADCLIDEQHTGHYFANSKHGLPSVSNEKKFNFAGNSHNRIVGSTSHNLKTKRSAVHKHQSAAGAMFCAPVLGSEFQNEPITFSNIGKKDGENFHEMYKCHSKAVSCRLKTQRTESAGNSKVCTLPDHQTANELAEKSNGELLTYGPKPKEMYTGSCNRRSLYLFEKLTIPAKSQSAYPKNSASSGKSSGFGVCMYGTNIGSQLFGARNQSSAKTETLHSDTLIGSKSSAGIASLSAQKDNGWPAPDEAKSEQLAAPSSNTKRGDPGYSKEDGSHNLNEGHDVSCKATVGSKQPRMPGAGITNLDLILSQMSRMRNQIPSGGVTRPPTGAGAGAEPSDRWLERLQLGIPDPDVPGSKRPKVGDSPPLRQRNRSVDVARPCDRAGSGTGATDRGKEDRSLDDGEKVQGRAPIPEKSVNSWIGRWCQGGTPVFREGPGQGRQAAKPAGRLSEELEGQFPSTAAMAMMERAMHKLRPCEQHKKGPFVVWKTD